MFILGDHMVLNWTDQHLFILPQDGKFHLGMFQDTSETGCTIKSFDSYESAYEYMQFLVKTKSSADGKPLIKISEN